MTEKNPTEETMKLKTPRAQALYLCLLILIFFLSACASRQTVFPPALATIFPKDDKGPAEGWSWWVCRFKTQWPPEGEPLWAMDLLLAHAVVGPVLKEYANEIHWWRFHRRAGLDEGGHQLSFAFYSASPVAHQIMGTLKQSTVLRQAMDAHLVEKIIFDDPGSPDHPQIEDLSDHLWSPKLQRNWPSYIMGVSSLWLGLIDDTMADIPGQSDDILMLLDRYVEAEKKISTLWYKEGQHALIHHLSAIFGYKPMRIIEEIQF